MNVVFDCEEEPPQYVNAKTIGYVPTLFPWSEATVARPLYFYDGKWWDIEWCGCWSVAEHPELEDEIIFDSKEDALLVGA